MKYLLLSLITLLFVSCSSKKYFEPKEFTRDITKLRVVTSRVSLSNTTARVATFSDANVLSNNKKFKIEKGLKAIGEENGFVVATNNYGTVKVYHDNKELYSHNFGKLVVSATYKNTFLALVFADNTIVLYDTRRDETLFSKSLEKSLAINAKVEAPKFLSKIVIFPTLDGRLYILDLLTKKVVQDIHISDKQYFNNIIFLKTYEDRLITATSSKIVTIKNQNFLNKEMGIKNVLVNNEFIYILSKDAEVIKLDLRLNKISSIKLPYSNFSGATFYNNRLFVLEKQGYLIELDEGLNLISVKDLNINIDSHIFMSNGVIYYENLVYFLRNK